MSETRTMLSCRNVSIRYKVGDFKNIGLKEWVVRRATRNYKVHEFMADRDVNFRLERGDMLGIIGTNGAGKSTLLKAVSGIMVPTKGQIIRHGKVAALLELGSGFDGDLTVRENAYLRGAMLGYTRAYMDETYPYIIEFAELKDFEDRPFKQLSSGMKSRLAFAIASLVRPEILILDEVLAVGDGAFRKKSEDKMLEIIRGGATTILVSHSIPQVRALCNKVLWLHKGRQIEFTDDVAGCCNRYEAFLKKPHVDPVPLLRQLKIVFDPAGGEVGEKERRVSAGYEIGVPPAVSRRGHLFEGWFASDGTMLAPDTKAVGDTCYVAQWRPVTYAVKFNPNGGRLSGDGFGDKAGRNAAASVEFAYGELAEAPLRAASKRGSLFRGWFAGRPNGERVFNIKGEPIPGTSLFDGDGKWISESNAVVYALWKKPPSRGRKRGAGGKRRV